MRCTKKKAEARNYCAISEFLNPKQIAFYLSIYLNTIFFTTMDETLFEETEQDRVEIFFSAFRLSCSIIEAYLDHLYSAQLITTSLPCL